jgi:hypothetical protein
MCPLTAVSYLNALNAKNRNLQFLMITVGTIFWILHRMNRSHWLVQLSSDNLTQITGVLKIIEVSLEIVKNFTELYYKQVIPSNTNTNYEVTYVAIVL